MLKNEIIDNIEKELSILLDKLGEKRYIEFIKGNVLLLIYDQIDDELYSSYIFDKKFLKLRTSLILLKVLNHIKRYLIIIFYLTLL